jgi:hypothetical protein
VISYDSQRGGVSVITEKGDITTSYLLIQNADLADSGRYSCSPSNADVASVRVHVLNGNLIAFTLIHLFVFKMKRSPRIRWDYASFPLLTLPISSLTMTPCLKRNIALLNKMKERSWALFFPLHDESYVES